MGKKKVPKPATSGLERLMPRPTGKPKPKPPVSPTDDGTWWIVAFNQISVVCRLRVEEDATDKWFRNKLRRRALKAIRVYDADAAFPTDEPTITEYFDESINASTKNKNLQTVFLK